MTSFIHPALATNATFFTVRLQDPQSRLLVDQVDILRQSFRVCRKSMPFQIMAAVVLPARLHMIWSLPDKDDDHAARWRIVKSTFSRHCPKPDTADLSPAMIRRREKGIWQRSFWQHDIRDQSDYDLHEHLIIHAPVSEGLVPRPGDWALSSLHTRGQGVRFAPKVAMPATTISRPVADALF
ncbi:transposase [Rhodobacteraceae bacterium S2214]|nr:transposase [Rhodobacteraceae bacterium S2214]